MSVGLLPIDERRVLDRERIAEYLKKQPPLKHEEWLEQIRMFEAAGRDTASAIPFWKRMLWPKR
jgi:hypothetical protein